jgi:hypothetical protein
LNGGSSKLVVQVVKPNPFGRLVRILVVLVAVLLLLLAYDAINRATIYIREGKNKPAESELKYANDRIVELFALGLGWVTGSLISRAYTYYKKQKPAPPPPPPPPPPLRIVPDV